MKRMTVLFLAAALCLWLAACSKEPGHGENPQEIQAEATDTEGSEEMQQSGSPTHSEGTAEESGEPAQQSIELARPVFHGIVADDSVKCDPVQVHVIVSVAGIDDIMVAVRKN